MKLQPDKSNVPLIRAYDSSRIQIDNLVFQGSVLVSSFGENEPQVWAPRRMSDLQIQKLTAMTHSGAELVILGTGLLQVLPPAAWSDFFARQRVGLECMSTAAACRTYNILAGEGRRVLAALLLDSTESLMQPEGCLR